MKWILKLPLEFNGESAFESKSIFIFIFCNLKKFETSSVSKPLSLFAILVDSLGVHFNPKSEEYVQIMFDNTNTSFAEVRIRCLQ